MHWVKTVIKLLRISYIQGKEIYDESESVTKFLYCKVWKYQSKGCRSQSVSNKILQDDFMTCICKNENSFSLFYEDKILLRYISQNGLVFFIIIICVMQITLINFLHSFTRYNSKCILQGTFNYLILI